MKSEELRWRYSRSTQRHYFEGSSVGYAYIDKHDDGYEATVPLTNSSTSKHWSTLREAKAWVEDRVRNKLGRRKLDGAGDISNG